MFVPRQQYPRELKIATMRELDSGKSIGEGGGRLASKSETAGDLGR
jgi:hypothetical protein